jgi:hypothetical protein
LMPVNRPTPEMTPIKTTKSTTTMLFLLSIEAS